MYVLLRNVNKQIVGELGEHAEFTCALKKNATGVWTITLPATIVNPYTGVKEPHPALVELKKPGSGVYVDLPGGKVFSGSSETMRRVRSASDPDGVWEITGISDADVLDGEVTYPDPTNDSPGTQAALQYEMTGAAEKVLKDTVNKNVGPAAPVSRRIPGLVVETSANLGGSVTVSTAFQNLGEFCRQVAARGDVLFDVYQQGAGLRLVVWARVDKTASIEFSIENGALEDETLSLSAPAASEVLVLGGALSGKRTVVRRTDPGATSAADAWGRRRVRVVSASGTNGTELAQIGDTELQAAGWARESFDVTPSDAVQWVAGVDYWLGTIVSVSKDGATTPAEITEVRFAQTPHGDIVGVTVGDPFADEESEHLAQSITDVTSRVSAIERNIGFIPTGATQTTDWNLAIEPGSYWSYMGGTLNAPVSAWLMGTVEDFGSGSNRLRLQSVYIANASEGQSGYGTVWRRYYNITTGTFTTTWAPLMPPAHSHTKADITDFAHTHDWSEVKAYPDTGNLFRNGYFRWGLTDWSVPADVTASVVTVPDGPNGQSTSVLRATPLDSDGGILNVLPTGTAEGQVIPGMTYDCILVARVVSGSTGNCRIRLGFQSAGLTNQWPVVDGTNLAGSSTNGVWQTLVGSYTVSPTEPRERMSAAIHFSGNSGSTTYEIASVTMIPRGINVPRLPLARSDIAPATLGILNRPSTSTTSVPTGEWKVVTFIPAASSIVQGGFAYASGGLTIPVTGIYRVSAGLIFDNGGGSSSIYSMRVDVDGVSNTYLEGRNTVVTVGPVTLQRSAFLSLTAGQVLSLSAFHNTGGARNVHSAQLSAELI